MMYIDDLAGASLGRDVAEADLADAIAVCEAMGFPVAASKVVQPTRCLEAVLGGRVDLDAWEVSLANSFIAKLQMRTTDVLDAASVEISAVETLAYSHSYVALFYPELKPHVATSFAFYRATQSARRGAITLTYAFRVNCQRFLGATHSDRRLPLAPPLTFPARGSRWRIDIESDASGEVGWGFVALPAPDWVDHQVFYAHGTWSAAESHMHINEKELYTSLIAACALGDMLP